MSRESSPESDKAQRRSGPPTTHDQPIIIDGSGSVALLFDSIEPPAHYAEPSESLYAGAGLFIISVSVRRNPNDRPGSGTQCELPFHRICTVEVEGRHQQSQVDSPIMVQGRPGAIIVRVDPSHYPKVSGRNTRKVHHSPLHKIRSLRIRDDIVGTTRDFSDLLPSNGKGIIDIIDEHILDNIGALVTQFDERTE